MNANDIKNMKYGQQVFYVSNPGMSGIFKYQYIGIHKDMYMNKGIEKHVFISEFLLSTVTITVGKEDKASHINKTLHLTMESAKKYHKSIQNKISY